jgi:multidrug efflux system membrane fusion protein
VKCLTPENPVSQQEYDGCKRSVRQGNTALNVARAAVQQAKIHLEYYSIVAPIDGVARTYLIDHGDMLSQAMPSSSTLVNIHNMNKLCIVLAIWHNYSAELYKVFNRSGGGSDVEVKLMSNNEISAMAELEFTENAISGQSGSINLRAVLCNGDRKL